MDIGYISTAGNHNLPAHVQERGEAGWLNQSGLEKDPSR